MHALGGTEIQLCVLLSRAAAAACYRSRSAGAHDTHRYLVTPTLVRVWRPLVAAVGSDMHGFFSLQGLRTITTFMILTGAYDFHPDPVSPLLMFNCENCPRR